MKKILPIIVFFAAVIIYQFITFKKDPYKKEINSYREEVNLYFAGSSSPLPEEERTKFEALNYFPVDEDYRIEATFVPAEKDSVFKMQTNTERQPLYKKYGTASFKIRGIDCSLAVYQQLDTLERAVNPRLLFLPFKDITNGEQTYGAGRYLDLALPEGNTILLDFNKSYNPYCAYNHRYSCPIPPYENHLDIKIEAGVKKYH